MHAHAVRTEGLAGMHPHAREALAQVLACGPQEGQHELLRGAGGYTVSGLLCEAYRQRTGEGKWTPFANGEAYYFKVKGETPLCAEIPAPVLLWAGLMSWAQPYGITFAQARAAIGV